MTSAQPSAAPFYADWRCYNHRFVDGIRGRAADDLALGLHGRPHLDLWLPAPPARTAGV